MPKKTNDATMLPLDQGYFDPRCCGASNKDKQGRCDSESEDDCVERISMATMVERASYGVLGCPQ